MRFWFLLPCLLKHLRNFRQNHQPQFIPRCIDAHAIQKDSSSEEQLAMNDDDHQNLICNFGNPQENRDHHQQHLGSIVLFLEQ